MKTEGLIENASDEELVRLFSRASSSQEKLQYFSRIQDYTLQMKLLENIPNNEKYKFIGKIRSTHGIAMALNGLEDENTTRKTFNFIAKQFKGNESGLLEILSHINFDVNIQPKMLTFKLNNLNVLSLDLLIHIQRHTKNYLKMKFMINEHEGESKNIQYSFSEISAIISKIEELTIDIQEDMDEANKFYKIYSRITEMLTYDDNCIRQQDQARDIYTNDKWEEAYERRMKEIRKNPAGLYGGLVDGKAICAGYALILNEALKYVGIKSQYVRGFIPGNEGHAWNQVQIDGKWYNTDPTWDSDTIQLYGIYENMLLSDDDFSKTHGKFSYMRTKTEHECKSKFDYSKIHGLSTRQISTPGKEK